MPATTSTAAATPSQVLRYAAPTITSAPTITTRRNRNASASLRSGFASASEDVDGRVDDDPHHVDEVPVDPADLDAVMVLRGEVPAEGADRHEEQDRQADEDVRAVQAGEAEEDRRERAVVRGEADARVLESLRDRGTSGPSGTSAAGPARRPNTLPRLIDCSAQCIVNDDVTRMHVLMSATKTGRWNGGVGHGVPVDDAHEEVGREERAEEHDLRRDEEEHAEDARRRSASCSAARAGARARRGRACSACGGHQALTPPGRRPRRARPAGFVSLRSRSTRSRRSQPERAPGNVETMISSTRSSCIVCMRRRERIGMRDLAVHVDALAAQQRHRAQQALLGLLVASLASRPAAR